MISNLFFLPLFSIYFLKQNKDKLYYLCALTKCANNMSKWTYNYELNLLRLVLKLRKMDTYVIKRQKL